MASQDNARITNTPHAHYADLFHIKKIIKSTLEKLYSIDAPLFARNQGKGVCERSLVFRFAHYLQTEFEKEKLDFFIDCDFNSSWDEWGRDVSGKIIQTSGGPKKKFIDIITHKRTKNTDFICFEIKKWNNTSKDRIDKDINNLKQLTSAYGYKFGFQIILGKTKNSTKWAIFKRNEHTTPTPTPVFDNIV